MNWKNTSHDHPPQKGEEVIISVDGIYYLTIYDAEFNVYRLSEEPQSVFDPQEHIIYWMSQEKNDFATDNDAITAQSQ